jgi:hypothetical protein
VKKCPDFPNVFGLNNNSKLKRLISRMAILHRQSIDWHLSVLERNGLRVGDRQDFLDNAQNLYETKLRAEIALYFAKSLRPAIEEAVSKLTPEQIDKHQLQPLIDNFRSETLCQQT